MGLKESRVLPAMINWASLIDLLDSARNPGIKRFHKESIFCENGSLTQTSQDSNLEPFIVAAHPKIDVSFCLRIL